MLPDIHPGHHLYARENGGVHVHRIALVIEEHPIDPEPDLQLRSPGLEVDVAGAGRDGGLQQLAHQGDRRRVLPPSHHRAGAHVRLHHEPGLHERGAGLQVLPLPVEALDAPVYHPQVRPGGADVLAGEAAQLVELEDIGRIHHCADEGAPLHLHRQNLEAHCLAAGDQLDGNVIDIEIELRDCRHRVIAHRYTPQN